MKKNIDFFLKSDVFETVVTGGPFYGGAQNLPSQNTDDYEKTRKEKVKQIEAETEALVKACRKAKPALAELRSEYIVFLDKVYKERSGARKNCLGNLKHSFSERY